MKPKNDSQPPPADRELTGPRYWKSLDELADTPSFRKWVQKEFPAGADQLEGVDRRQFMKIMGASFAFAGLGLSGCRQPENKILPYSKYPKDSPEALIPGVPTYYATSMPGPFENIPLVVETHQARPTKIEGNPSYTPFGGGTDIYAQASILDLYDPDRAPASFEGTRQMTPAEVDDLLAAIHNDFSAKKGKGLAILAEPSTSDTRRRLQRKLMEKMPQAIWAEYAPVDLRSQFERKESVRPVYNLSGAKIVASLDGDFQRREIGHLGMARQFADGRRVAGADTADMNRLYAVESEFTLTGSNADHRLRLSTSEIPAFVALLARELGVEAPEVAVPAGYGAGARKDRDFVRKWARELAADLKAHTGESVVLCGPHLPEPVQAAVMAVNQAIGAVGTHVTLRGTGQEKAATISELASAMEAGTVETLVILGGNPAYDAPADLNFAEKMQQAGRVVRHGYHVDDTTQAAQYHLAAAHYLESWSDGRTCDGAYVPVQPMIQPFWEVRGEIEVLAALADVGTTDAYKLVKETYFTMPGAGEGGLAFDDWLAEGILAGSGFGAVDAPPSIGDTPLRAEDFSPPEGLGPQNLEVRIIPDFHTWDGRYSNNGWMQEVPEPMSKLTWENAILVSPVMAREMKITADPIRMNKLGQLNIDANQFKDGKEQAPLATVSTPDGRTVTGPVHAMPGLADYTLVLALGYGRGVTGRVGSDRTGEHGRGYNAYKLLTSDAPAARTGAKLELTGEVQELANTQQHWSMEGRAIIREANLEDYKAHPGFADEMGMEAHSPPIYGKEKDASVREKALTQPRGGSLYKPPAFADPPPNYDVWTSKEGREKYPTPQQWGMSIDLTTCTGCNACVVACQSENNIPIVGKDQVLRGREMHWIRLDRYFSSGRDPEDDQTATLEAPEDPQVSFMGMACVHCELAPCESVCPFNATVHDEEGLNVMAYNRCAGTRYCANNCPYKVRRFNFFDWNKRDINELYKGPLGTNKYKTEAGDMMRMQHNPDVTVRMRGVMEKCTYCVQRIQGAKIEQLRKAGASGDVYVPDGHITVACQQACPTDAIVFGDISEPDSRVYKLKQNERDYSVLGYLNVRPRTTYLARLRNPNPKMPDYHEQPLSRVEYEQKAGGAHGAHGGNGHGVDGEHGPDTHGAAPGGKDAGGNGAH